MEIVNTYEKKITQVTNVSVDQVILLRAWSKQQQQIGSRGEQAFEKEKEGQQEGKHSNYVSFIVQAK